MYDCPRERLHSVESLEVYIHGENPQYLKIRRGLVDLVLRAQQYGLKYGISPSVFNMSGRDYYGVFWKNEARMVNGQLILASSLEAEAVSGDQIDELLEQRLFPHFCQYISASWCTIQARRRLRQDFVQAFASTLVGAEKSEVVKCPCCETDHRLYMRKVTIIE